ncbi:MAG: hypothetical protein QNJ64_16460 [Crocosphaera sp.]|nr:hypothetical protein [Crocosphaera sp.]
MNKIIKFSVFLCLTLLFIITVNTQILSSSDIWYIAESKKANNSLEYSDIIAIIGGIIVPITLLFASEFLRPKHKKMSYKIISKTPFLSVNKGVLDDTKIFFKDEPVNRVNVIKIKILNSGDLMIKSTDFESEKPGIKILFKTNNNQFKILSTEIVNRSNLDMNPDIKIQDKEIIINSCLWNVDDFIEIKSLVNNYEISDEITVTAHIAGMKGDLSDISESEKPLEILLQAKELITFLLFLLSYLLLIFFILKIFLRDVQIIINFFDLFQKILLVVYILWLFVYVINYKYILFNHQYCEKFCSFFFKTNRQ